MLHYFLVVVNTIKTINNNIIFIYSALHYMQRH